MRIRTKLFVVYLIVVILLLGSVTQVLTQQYSRTMTDNITGNMTQTLSQLSYNLDNKLLSYEQIANSLYLNISLQEVLLHAYPDMESAYESYFNYLEPYSALIEGTQNVYRIRFFTDNPSFTFAKVILLNDQLKGEDWYRVLSSKRAQMFWSNRYRVPFADDTVISLTQKMDYLDPTAVLYASFEIREQEIMRLVEKESGDKRILFVRPSGEVLLDSSRKVDVQGKISQYPFAGQLGDKSGHFLYTSSEGSEALVLYQTLESRNSVSGMKVVFIVPLDKMMQSVDRMKGWAYLLFALSCGAATILIYLFSYGLTQRITQLARRMKTAHKEQYRGLVTIRGNDEVSQLGRYFNQMMDKVNHLINEVYKSELNRKELALRTRDAEFYALQAQIHPHYLFNVLNMLRGNLLERGDQQNSEIVSLLARSFRLLLQNKSETTTLGQELELVNIYLSIQKFRYDNRLSYRIDVSEEVHGVCIPTLSVQPLVENAIIHGMELNGGSTAVEVSARITNHLLQITVEDNGSGIPSEQLDDIHQQLRETHEVLQGHHIGLRNIHFRLIKIFGPDSGIQIFSEGKGTIVRFAVPLKPQ